MVERSRGVGSLAANERLFVIITQFITQFPLVRPAPLGILPASQAFHLFSCSQILQHTPDHVLRPQEPEQYRPADRLVQLFESQL